MANNIQSNFNFLSEQWAFLLQDAQQVESYAIRDPRAAAIYARRTLELSLKWLFANDTALKAPYEKNLAAMLYEPTFSRNIKKGLLDDIKFIHRLGNLAVHGDDNITSQEGLTTTRALHQFLGWMARVYTRGGAKPDQFHPSWLPQAESTQESEKKLAQLSTAQLDKIQDELKAKDDAAVAAEKKLSKTEAELIKLKQQLAQLQQVKETNKKSIGSREYNESQTRELMIDVMLREAGWNPKAENVEEYEVLNCMPTSSGERTGTGYVDYVLWGKDGRPVALVEAKRTRSDPKVGKRQAELYADCLEKLQGQRQCHQVKL